MIEQMQLLELFEEKLAPIIYNKALDDGKRWFGQMMENVESDYYTLYNHRHWNPTQITYIYSVIRQILQVISIYRHLIRLGIYRIRLAVFQKNLKMPEV